MNIRKITVCALLIALACVASMIKIYHFPFGGSVTLLSMLIITLPVWLYGTKYGIICGLIYGLIQFALGPYFISVPQFILDYVLAFSIMGAGGIIKGRENSLIRIYSLAVVLRWIMATLAGLAWVAAGSTVWDGWNPIFYSMVYNGAYIFTEGILTLFIISLAPMKKALDYIRFYAKNGSY